MKRCPSCGKEYSEEATQCEIDGQPLETPQTAPPSNFNFSATSVVLAVLSVFTLFARFWVFSLILGILAFITGAIALAKAKKGGKVAPVFSLSLGLIMSLFVGVSLSLVSSARQQRAEVLNCVVIHMRVIAKAAKDCAESNGGKLPMHFLSLADYLDSPAILVCPNDKTKTPAKNWAEFNEALNCSYEFLSPNQTDSNSGTQPLIYCPNHDYIVMSDIMDDCLVDKEWRVIQFEGYEKDAQVMRGQIIKH